MQTYKDQPAANLSSKTTTITLDKHEQTEDVDMIKLPRVMVLANCIHISLALALRKSGLFSSVESAELYSMPPEKLTTLADHLNEYDFILTIEHGLNFGPLATSTLRQNHGGKVVTLPTPFFSVLMPDMAYVKYRDELARAGSILGDYHSALILAEAQAGLSEEDVVTRYVSGQAFKCLDIQGVWEDSLAELRKREVETDITLSDFIERRALEGVVVDDFLSFNHPTEHLINHIADSFACLTLDKSTLDRPLLAAEHNLYLDAYWPIHPKVSETLGLPINPNQKFKAPNRLGGRVLSRAEFARASFRFFTTGSAVQDYQPTTPAYLPSRLKLSPTESMTTRNYDEFKALPSSQNKQYLSIPIQRKVNLIIIGTAKSGTTSLFTSLGQSSDIATSLVKEVAYFNRHSEVEKGIEYYHSKFKVKNEKYILEATPEYSARFMYPDVAKRIYEYNNKARLIFCVRDPLQRIASQYVHFSQVFPDNYPNPTCCINSFLGVKNITFRSLYNNSILAFEKLFKKDKIFIFDLDNREQSMSELSSWLDIKLPALSKVNVRSTPGIKNPIHMIVQNVIQQSPYFDLIRSDAQLFSARFGVGTNWPTLS